MGGSTLARLNVLLGLNAKQFKSGLESAQSSLDRFGQRMRSWGRSMTTFVTLPLIGAGVAFVKWASDVEEATSAVTQVYGEGADYIIKKSKDAADTVFLSQGEYLSAAATLGVYGDAAGLAGDAQARFGDDLIGAAADLASFYNAAGGAPQVLDDIKSGLTGEYEPLRKYGILLNEAELNEYAWANGIVARGAEMTEQEKVLARQMYIMDHLGAAEGDAAKTAGGLANTIRRLRARFIDIGATIGKVLLPVALKIADAVASLFDRLEKLSPSALKIVVVFGAIAAAIGPLLLILGSLAGAVSSIAGLFGTGGVLAGAGTTLLGLLGPLALVAAAGAALFLAWKTNFLGIRDILDGVLDFVRDVFSVGLADALRGIGGDATPGWIVKLAEWADRASAFVGEVRGYFEILRDRGVGPTEAAFIAFGNALDNLLGTNLSPFFTDLGQWLGATVLLVAMSAGMFEDQLLPQLTLLAEFSFAELMTWFSAIVTVLSLTLPGLIQGLVFGWIVAWASMKVMVTDILPVLDALVPLALQDIGRQLSALNTTFRAFVFGLDTAGKLIRSTFGVGLMIVREFAGWVKEIADGIGAIQSALELLDLGLLNPPEGAKDFWDGFLGGLMSQTPAGDVADIFGGIDDLFGGGGEASAAEAGGGAVTEAMTKPFTDGAASIITILSQLNTDISTEWIGIRDTTAVRTFEIKNKAEDNFVAMRNEVTRLAFDTRNAVTNEFNAMRQDADRLTELFYSVVTTNFRLTQSEVEKIAFGIRNTVVNQLVALRGEAGALAGGIGRAIGGGIWAGMSIWAAPIASLAAGMVRGAILAAKLEAQISSPSRKTMWLGEMMGQGLAIGFERGAGGLFGGWSTGAAFGGGGSSEATFINYGTISNGVGPTGGTDPMRGWRYAEARA